MPQTNGADLDIDITGEICPMTYVRTRLALEHLSAGQILGVTLQGEEPARNVPAAAMRQGHLVLARQDLGGGAVRLLIRRG
jgi:TusA-related sulfurtransferase